MTTVLVTGANRGIGLEFVRQYADDGAGVIACCRQPSAADELAELTKRAGGRIRIKPLDVGDFASIAALKADLDDEPIDIVVNNAGRTTVVKDRVEPDEWLDTMRVNALAPMLIAQEFRSNMMLGRDRKLAVVSSIFGSTSNPTVGNYAYRASKAAVNNSMHALALDWARDGFLVAILNPGWVKTKMGGGDIAYITAEESVREMKQRIADLDSTTSGIFLDYRGGIIRW